MKKFFLVLSVIVLFAASCSDKEKDKKAKEAASGPRVSGTASPAPQISGAGSPAPHLSGR